MADGERMIEPIMSAKIDETKETNRKGRHFTVVVECLPCFFMLAADQMIGFF